MWKELIHHLASQGVSQYSMAKAAGVDQSTICRLATGRGEPRYSAGKALIDLGGGLEVLRQKGVISSVPTFSANDPQPPATEAAGQGVANV